MSRVTPQHTPAQLLCRHDFGERDMAVVDGMCPLCLAADRARLQSRIDQLEELTDRQASQGIEIAAKCDRLKAREERLLGALREIAEATKRKQLPLTALINERARAALAESGEPT